MLRRCAYLAALSVCAFVPAAATLAAEFKPVTAETLLNPDPADWLMINRTYDEQRFSPLNQINRSNVGELRMAWTRGMPPGTQESTPMVYNGVMYVIAPGGGVQALDGTSGDLIWEYWRTYPKDMAQTIRAATLSRGKNLAMFEDMVYFAAADGFLVALDAQTGKVRWETKAHDYTKGTEHTGGLMVADGKVISNRTCTQREGCFIAAHDAKTGAEVWKFFNTASPDEPGGDTWGDLAPEKRSASSWGLPGSYDPKRKVIYWAIANPTPYTRLKRHGSADAVSNTSPSELYSNSTVALDVDTGKLVWYYQHLPGDDWDSDHIHERTLLRTKVSPDPKFVKWINPTVPKDEERDIVVEVAEAGDVFALDRDTGKFLWAMPFPYDSPGQTLQSIDVETGRTHINVDDMFKKEGDKRLTCSYNTRSWWSTAYDPGRNALYVPFHDACLNMTANQKRRDRRRPAVRRPAARHRRERLRRHHEDQSLDRRDDADSLAALAGQWLGAGHRRRSAVLGRSQPPLPRLRFRHRQGAVGGAARRHDHGEHHQLRGRTASNISRCSPATASPAPATCWPMCRSSKRCAATTPCMCSRCRIRNENVGSPR